MLCGFMPKQSHTDARFDEKYKEGQRRVSVFVVLEKASDRVLYEGV